MIRIWNGSGTDEKRLEKWHHLHGVVNIGLAFILLLLVLAVSTRLVLRVDLNKNIFTYLHDRMHF